MTAETGVVSSRHGASISSMIDTFLPTAYIVVRMGNTITIRVPEPLAAWLQEKAARTGISQGQIVREQLERVRRGDKKTKKFMRLAGA